MADDREVVNQYIRRRMKLRARRMSFVTLAMAAFYFCGADVVLNGGDRYHLEFDGIRYTNSARATLAMMMPPPASTGTQPVGFGRFFQFGPPRTTGGGSAGPTDEQRQAYTRVMLEISAVEGAVYIWERVIWGLCLALLAVALLAWITPWGRAFHLLAALAIFAVTFFSLACLRYLELPVDCGESLWPLSPERYTALLQRWNLPEGGGMPPLLPRTYLAVAAILSTYGWVLVAAFVRPGKPPQEEPTEEDVTSPDPE